MDSRAHTPANKIACAARAKADDRDEVAARLDHVALRYESGTQALEDVSLTLRFGERLCVLGANGSGKSTLASVLAGLLAPDQGRVSLLGHDVFDEKRPERVDFAAYRAARRSLGLVFQNPDDQIVTTVVEEDVAFGPENLGLPGSEIGRRVERELARVALTSYAKADPTRLSGGQKQRVAIAGSLAMEPGLIVFDEPGSLLDVRGRSSILRVMGKLQEAGTTIVHITHFMEEALEADRVIVLAAGRIVLQGTPHEVFAHEAQITQLGLEEPFVARLSRRLFLPWTVDDAELRRSIREHYGAGLHSGDTDAGPARSPAQTRTVLGPAALDVRNVRYTYDGVRQALDGITLCIEQGLLAAIVGQTGSGKSTLLRLLCALEAPDSGEVIVAGTPTARKRDRRRLHGRVGYVMQHPERQLFAETVRDDVAFGPSNLGLSASEVQTRCTEALRLVGLSGLEDASPFELSGGQQRLCALAGVLAMDPHILVLDEPTAGLDPRGRAELRKILAGVHSRGITVVQVTHSMEDAVHAQRVFVLDQSRLMLSGTPSEVFCAEHEQALREAGLGLPQALLWALSLEREGMDGLGSPLTTDALVDALVRRKAG